ncbi:DUF1127 domain-containing protein [Microvirga sp. HBU67558]|uniref:DUF1127 domain-containing protein n=1 Tax=Microvirga TaxID=186650 RepID=UPI001B379406|nr:DUF1127 domain-containing protein [Microvirga sp. HBU67655]MBQ0822627.1 DUF1127 domain-containing protein [Microvirga sp. HBU67558]
MFVAHVLSTIRSFRRHRASLRELSRLSDRDLKDLGLSRYEIEQSPNPRMSRQDLMPFRAWDHWSPKSGRKQEVGTADGNDMRKRQA